MPHTNRARRAQHFRSIDNTSESVDDSRTTTNTPASRKKKVHSHESNGGGGGGSGGGGGGAYSLYEKNGDGRSDVAGHKTVIGMVGNVQRQASEGKGGSRKSPSSKNRIRSLTRLLNKPGIDEGQREHLKAQVEALEKQVNDREKNERERTLALKYHKAKFFDRRRTLRRLAQLHRKLNGDLEEGVRLDLEERRRSDENDLKYVLYFPKDKRYIPLEKGKAGPPRARRSYDRLLKEALSRGEAAGWTEFHHNLDKFVVSSGENRSISGESGIKRKRSLHTLPVITQENIWDEDEPRGDEEVTMSESEGKGIREETELRVPKGNADSSLEQARNKRQAKPDSSARGDFDESSEEDEELSGDEGFGAADSDEEDAYSFAEARVRWEGGLAGDGPGDWDALNRSSGGKRSSLEGASNRREGSGDEAEDGRGGGGDSDDNSSLDNIDESSRSLLLTEPQDRSLSCSEDGSQDCSEDGDDSGEASEAEKGFNGREGVSGNMSSQKLPPLERLGSADRTSSGTEADEIALNDDFFLEEAGPSGTKVGGRGAADQGTRGDGKNRSNAFRGRGGARGRSGRGWMKQGRGPRGNVGDLGRGGRSGRGSRHGVGRGRGRGRTSTKGPGRGAEFSSGDSRGGGRPNKITRFEDDDD